MDRSLSELNLSFVEQIEPNAENCAKLEELVIAEFNTKNDEELTRKEKAIMKLAIVYEKCKNVAGFEKLLEYARGLIFTISRVRAAKILRDLFDVYIEMECSKLPGIRLCIDCLKNLRGEQQKPTVLYQILQTKLIALYFEQKLYQEASNLAMQMTYELKKIDNKELLIDVLLLDSKIQYAMGGFIRSRASLTGAKTIASSIYVLPKQQAKLDMQSGALHAIEKDYKTAYSYFYEAFDLWNSIDSPKAMIPLKYMIMCKIMLNKVDEIPSLMSNSLMAKYRGSSQLEAMISVANASRTSSLKDLKQSLVNFRSELDGDLVIHHHVKNLMDTIFEKNLLSIITPYSSIELSFIASSIELDENEVVLKLSHMILDEKLSAVIDQGRGTLEIMVKPTADPILEQGIHLVNSLTNVVHHLTDLSTFIK